VKVDGTRIHYLHWGEIGRPGIVFVHGGAAHAHWWSFVRTAIRARLPRGCNRPVRARRQRPARRYPRDVWAREVMAVAQDAGCAGPPVVVGHSMGGFVTIATAAEFGDRIAGAVILDSPVRRPDPEKRRARAARRSAIRRSIPTSTPRCATSAPCPISPRRCRT
jgi:pimeloyl-ACP methyl ester carboxylesterase